MGHVAKRGAELNQRTARVWAVWSGVAKAMRMFASSRQTLLLILKGLDIQRGYAANAAERGEAEFLTNGVIARL